MPLKAILDGEEIHSFTFNEREWEELKDSYRKRTLVMSCCGHGAIPKTSKLNNFHFSHKPKSDCQYARESPDHLYLKFLIAKLAHKAGWSVTTEKSGQTPTGEQWIADVYCTKNNVQLIFEVQLSQQSMDAFKERQAKYTASGINRVLWLHKLRKGKEFYFRDICISYDLPMFGLLQDENNNYYLPQFSVSVDQFITGVLNKKLAWYPQNNAKLQAKVILYKEKCWCCGKNTNRVQGIGVHSLDDTALDFISFHNHDCKDLIYHNIKNETLKSYGVGELKVRYSKTKKEFYFSNGCKYCDALLGDIYLPDAPLSFEYQASIYKSIVAFTFDYRGSPFIEPNWYFQGKRAKLI
ncbi:TPA: hypothetical protein PC598_001812 [Morganella morganii]|nr:hypothetical protein [Morganella morganii]